MNEWTPINHWEIKKGEEFLVVVEGPDYKTVSPAIYRNGRFEVERFFGEFRDRPECTHISRGAVRRITHAAKFEYPKSLFDKILKHSVLRQGDKDSYDMGIYCKELVDIVEAHYKGGK